MKRTVLQLVLGAVLGSMLATVVQSQTPSFREKFKDWKPLPVGGFKSPDPFVGKWEIDKEKSTSYPRIENIEVKVDGDMQDYKNDIADDPGPTRHQGYENRYNEILWVPYMRENTGKPFMYSMTIKVDDRTHFRMVRKLDGTSGGVMMRRLAPDGQSYVSTGMDENGNIQYKRTYKKVDRFTLTTATADTPVKRGDPQR
jgi:hypothetical protein